MTEFVLQAVDTDDSTILFDFQDPTGLNNLFFGMGGVRTAFGLDGQFSIGVPARDIQSFSSDLYDGTRIVRSRVRARQVSWSQRIDADSYDAMAATVGNITQIFRRGGTLKWQPVGAAEARWLDFMPSDAPFLFGGYPFSLHQLIEEFDSVQGVPISLQTQPYLRGPTLESATNYLLNGTMLREDTAIAGHPSDWTWEDGTGIDQEGLLDQQEWYRFRIQNASVQALTQTTAAASAVEDDVWTAAMDVQCISGTSARVSMRARFYNGTTPLGTEMGSSYAALVATGAAGRQQGPWTRVSITTDAAPPTTDRIKVWVSFDNTDANANVIWLRNAQAEKLAATLFVPGTDTMGNDANSAIPIFVQGNAWAPVSLTLRIPDADSTVQEFLVARRSQNGEPQIKRTLSLVVSSTDQCADGALSNDTSLTTDGEGSTIARTSYAADSDVLKKRVRITAPQETAQARRGTWDVWLRCAASAASVHEIQLRWAASFLTPPPNSNAIATLDVSSATSFPYVWVFLGSYHVPYDFNQVEGLGFEIWSRLVSGTGTLSFHFINHAPVDDPEPSLTRILAPARSQETWLGSQLETPAAEITGDPSLIAGDIPEGDVLRINSQYESGGTPPNSGAAWDPGRHRITFHRAETILVNATCIYRVVNITDNALVTSKTEVYTSDTVNGDLELDFDTVAGKVYQASAYLSAQSNNGVRIASIDHETIPFLPQDAAVLTDSETGLVARVDEDDQFQTRLDAEGPIPVYCPPGLSCLYVHAADVPPSGYEVGESVLARTWTVGIRYAPRYWT